MNPTDPETASGPLFLRRGEDWDIPQPLARILAWTMDAVASVVITLCLYRFVGGFLLNVFDHDSFLGLTLANSLWFIGGLGYWVITPAWSGATPAKMLFNLRIVPLAEAPLTPVQIVMREVLGHAAMIASAGLGFLAALRDPDGRGPNDRIAGTRLIQFTASRPELYRIQDLQAAPEEVDTYVSYTVQVLEAPPASPGAPEPAPPGAPDSPPTPSSTHPQAAARSRPGESFYARQGAGTAWERKQQAALGPTVAEISEALHRTAGLVRDGQLMPKVLERKRTEFIEQLARVRLGDDPTAAVRAVVELGRAGILEREQLELARDILKKRLSKQRTDP